MKRFVLLTAAFMVLISACKDTQEPATPKLLFKFKFDPTQQRLDNLGQPAAMPAGHAGQSPSFNKMSAHYIELAPTALTQIGSGVVLYHAPETSAGGAVAIDFSKSVLAANGETFFSMPLKDVAPGTYEWLRVSLAYQNYDVQMHIDTTVNSYHYVADVPATVASFIGYNTYITTYTIKTQSVTVNDDKLQGYWGFETVMNILGSNYTFKSTGQAPPGATTVPNPIASTSPIPAGSCVVTGAVQPSALVITGNETEDIVIEVALSTNQSFEWIEVVTDGLWQPDAGETVVDMGIRGMVPTIK